MKIKASYLKNTANEELILEEKIIFNNRKSNLRFIQFGILLSGIAVFAQLYLFQPLLPIFTRNYKISPAYSSFIVAAGTVGMALGLLFFAFYADNFKRKSLMVLAILGASTLTITSSFVTDFEWLLGINLLKGFLLSGVTAVALAYLSEEVAIGSLGLAVGLYLSGNTIGGMLGRVITTYFSGAGNWQNGVLIVGIFSLIVGIVFMLVFPASQHFSPKKSSLKRRVILFSIFLKDKKLLAINTIGACVMGCFVSMYNYIGFRLEASPFNLDHKLVACIFFMYIIGVWGSLQSGKWLSQGLEKKKLLKCIIITFIGILLMMSFSLLWVIIGLGALTFGFFATHTLASKMVTQEVVIGKTTAVCIYWLFYYIGSSAIGSISGIILNNYGWNVFTFFLLILLIIACMLSWKFILKKKPFKILYN